jgi:dihydroflavonol-4-reductase
MIVLTGYGFIGKNIAESFRDVKVLSRKNIDRNCHIGDIRDISSLEGFIGKKDIVIHNAGIIGGTGKNEKDYFDTHVKGTKNLLACCTDQQFIYISSAGIHGPIIDGNEDSKISPTNVYEKSKLEAELLVRKYKNSVILRPEFLYGPHDMHVLKLFQAIQKKRFFLIGKGTSKLHPTYIGDLLFCIKKCIEKKIVGKTYIVAGERAVNVATLGSMIADELGTDLPRIRIHLGFARMYASTFGKVFPILTKSRLDFFTKTRTFSTKKAQHEIGFKPYPLSKGIHETVKWYKKNGYL